MNFSHTPADQMTFGSSYVISYSLSSVPWWISFSSAWSYQICLHGCSSTCDKWTNKNSVSFDVICMTVTYFCPFVLSNVTEIQEGKSLSGFTVQCEVILETLQLLKACCAFGRQNDVLTVLWPIIWTAPKQIKHKMKEARKRHLSHGSYAGDKWPELKVSSGLSSRLRPLWLSKSHFNHRCNLKLH